MKFLNMILLTTLLIFSNMLIAAGSPSISDDHCFAQDWENSFCYKTKKECEIERKNDVIAEGKCYKALD